VSKRHPVFNVQMQLNSEYITEGQPTRFFFCVVLMTHLQSFCWFYTTNICWWCMGAFWSRTRFHAGSPNFWCSSIHCRWGTECFTDVIKGAGPIGIPPLILKNCASAFARSLSLLFNESLSTSTFSDRWKFSYVTPIFKKGATT
jgi:hypothetical protein